MKKKERSKAKDKGDTAETSNAQAGTESGATDGTPLKKKRLISGGKEVVFKLGGGDDESDSGDEGKEPGISDSQEENTSLQPLPIAETAKIIIHEEDWLIELFPFLRAVSSRHLKIVQVETWAIVLSRKKFACRSGFRSPLKFKHPSVPLGFKWRGKLLCTKLCEGKGYRYPLRRAMASALTAGWLHTLNYLAFLATHSITDMNTYTNNRSGVVHMFSIIELLRTEERKYVIYSFYNVMQSKCVKCSLKKCWVLSYHVR